MVLSAFPHQPTRLLCLVGAEIGVPPSPRSRPRRPDGPGLWYRYRLTGIGPLGLGPAALTALLGDAVLAGAGLASTGLAGGGQAGDGLAGGGLAGGGLAGGPGTGPGGRATVRHTTGVPPEAAGAAALSMVVYARGRLAASGAGPPGSSGTGAPGTSPPGTRPARAAGPPGGNHHRATAGHVVVFGADLEVARAAIGLGAERLTLVGVPPARAGALSAARHSPARVRAAGPGDLAEVLAEADGLIQASPAPVPAGLLRPEAWIADLVYRPVASGAACPAPPGHRDGMLAWRTVGAFRLATGPGTDTERALRYLAAVTGTVAGNARTAPARTAPAR
jgi:quinate/shikimate dehydrogenase (NAD+)